MADKKEAINDKFELLKTLHEMWRHENDIANKKIAIFFTVQSILMISFAASTVITSILGFSISIIWFLSLGRTIVYRQHWDSHAIKLSSDLSEKSKAYYQIFPTIDEKKKMAWYGKVPSKIFLLGTPLFCALLWGVILVINLL